MGFGSLTVFLETPPAPPRRFLVALIARWRSPWSARPCRVSGVRCGNSTPDENVAMQDSWNSGYAAAGRLTWRFCPGRQAEPSTPVILRRRLRRATSAEAQVTPARRESVGGVGLVANAQLTLPDP